MAHLLRSTCCSRAPTCRTSSSELKKRGVGFNASTSLDRTNFFSFPANATLDYVRGLEADRMLRSNIAKKDLDSEMTVVRNGLERNENNPGRCPGGGACWPPPTSGTTTGIRHHRARAATWSSTCRSSGCRRSTAPGTSRTMRCCWSSPTLRSGQAAGRHRRKVRPVEEAGARIARRHGGGTGAGRRTRGQRAPQRRHPHHQRGMAHARGHPSRYPGADGAGQHPRPCAGQAACTKALVEAGWPVRRRRQGLCTIPAPSARWSRCRKDGDAKAEAELLEEVEDVAAQPITRRNWPMPSSIGNGYELAFNDVNAVGMASVRIHGRRRLAPVVRAARRDAWVGRRQPRGEDLPDPLVQPHAGALHPPATTRCPAIADAPSVASLVDGCTGAPRSLRRHSREHRRAHPDLHHRRLLTVSLLPKKTRGGTVVANADFRFADADALRRNPSAAPVSPGTMLMRGSKTMTREQIDKRFEALKTEASVSGGGVAPASPCRPAVANWLRH